MPVAVTRRRFLTLASSAGGAAMVHAVGRSSPMGLLIDGGIDARVAPGGGSVVTEVSTGRVALIRASDQAHLVYEFLNLDLVANELVPTGTGDSAIRITVGSQHRAEASITDAETAPDASAPVQHRAAAPTRLVLAVTEPVPFTVDALTALAGHDLVADPRSGPGGDAATGTGAPADDVTSLGLVHDVSLSPETGARASVLDGPTLWDVAPVHRIAVGHPDATPASPADPLPLRAVHGGEVDDDFVRVPDRDARGELVTATTGGGTAGYTANEPLLATELLLTLHGAFTRLAAIWEGTGQLGAYDAVTRSGRDLTVTVTERGYLAPFGVPASIISSTERRFEVAGDGTTAAVLVRDEQLVVGSEAVTTPGADQPHDGRQWPFTSVRAVAPTGGFSRGAVPGADADNAFDLVDDVGSLLPVDVVATDRAGNEVQFACPMTFVSAQVAFTPTGGDLDHVEAVWNDAGPAGTARRTLALDGQAVALADEVEPGSGATTKQVTSMLLEVQPPAGALDEAGLRAAGQPAFFPAMTSAVVTDDALDEVGNGRFGPFDVTLAPQWLDHGNDADDNLGRGFLHLDTPLLLDLAGPGRGLLKPELRVEVFGQDLGLSPDLSGGTWDPLAALGDANLLGLIWLADLLVGLPLSGGDLDDPRLPSYEITLEPPGLSPDQICVRVGWEPEVGSVQAPDDTWILVAGEDLEAAGLEPDWFDGEPMALSFSSEGCSALVPGTSTREAVLLVSLQHFGLLLPLGFPAIALLYDDLTLRSDDDGSTIDADLAGYQFVGALEFLEPFRGFLSATGAAFTITPRGRVGIDGSASFSPPDVDLGVVRLTQIGAGLDLFVPFGDSGQPLTTGFHVGTSAQPVQVAVTVFRGTGSFELELQPDPGGITRLRASFGVGLELAAGGLGVKGAVGAEVVGSIDQRAGEVVVAGAFSLWGELTIWGLAGVSVAGTVGVKYLVNQKLLRASGSVSGEVHLAWARKDWRIDVGEDYDLGDGGGAAAFGAASLRSRTASGRMNAFLGLAAPTPAGGGNSFGDQYDVKTWGAYCAAFA